LFTSATRSPFMTLFKYHSTCPCRKNCTLFSETICVIRDRYLHITSLGSWSHKRHFYGLRNTVHLGQTLRKLKSPNKTAYLLNFIHTNFQPTIYNYSYTQINYLKTRKYENISHYCLVQTVFSSSQSSLDHLQELHMCRIFRLKWKFIKWRTSKWLQSKFRWNKRRVLYYERLWS
jgi:hypothetical protein